MKEEDFLQIESSQRQHHEILLNELNQIAANERLEYNLFAILKPKIGIDGNQYFVLYGEDLQSGTAGFGDTLYLAILDFNKSFNKKLPK